MKKILITSAFIGIALSGCATHQINTFQPFQTKDLNPLLDSNALQQKTDTFYIINDASSSMSETYWGEGFPGQSEPTKFFVEREILIRMSKAIPKITLSSGIRSFGYGPCVSWGFSKLNQPIQSYSPSSFKNALSELECSSGGSPIKYALEDASVDLASAPGKIALIILSDGHNFDASPASAVQSLKEQYGDRLCVSTVWVGNEVDQDGQAVLQQLSSVSGCGFSATISELATTKGMAKFVQNVFFDTVSPAANVGITDGDEDGDGVPDSKDNCPGTPKGAVVDKDGCWAFRGVFFDFDRYAIKSDTNHVFDNSIKVLRQNPDMEVELQGHTDSTGTEGYNQGLSERRAASVKQHLVNHGIGSSRLTTKGFGETKPITPNSTKAGRKHNRRVMYKIAE